MKLRFFLKNYGQTTIEYLLVISLAVTVGMLFLKKMNEFLIKNPDGLISKSLDSYIRAIKGDGSPQNAYRRFYVRKVSRKR